MIIVNVFIEKSVNLKVMSPSFTNLKKVLSIIKKVLSIIISFTGFKTTMINKDWLSSLSQIRLKMWPMRKKAEIKTTGK